MISSLPTIAKAAEQIRAGQITPLDLVEHCLSRIQQFEGRVRAWVLVDEEGARREARRQMELLRRGDDPGPLAGIPIGIKDIIDVASWPTEAGSSLRKDLVARQDARLVKRLRATGAIFLGKTVTTEFAYFDPPPTLNPWNLDRTPGGSSSGSAAAVALEMCMAAIGSQTGGSIIRPASYCGVVGFKPTFGQISLEGVVPVSRHLDHAGPITRCVADAACLYDHLAEVPIPTEAHVWTEPTSDLQLSKLRAVEQFFLDEAASDVVERTRAALAKILSPWGEEHALDLPESFGEVPACHKRVMAVDAAAFHRDAFSQTPEAFGPHISELVQTGLATNAVDYAVSVRFQQHFREDIEQMLGSDVIAVIPATVTTAPSVETTGDPKFNSPWSFAGLPTITIPCGLGADGMPCGLQLLGPRHSEPRLLNAAAWCEQRLSFHERPELLHG